MLATVPRRCVKDSSRPLYTRPPPCLTWKGTGGAPPYPGPARLRLPPLPPLCPDSAASHPSQPGGNPSHQLHQLFHLAPVVFSPILPPANTPPSHLQYWREVPQDYELVFMGKHCHGVPHMHTYEASMLGYACRAGQCIWGRAVPASS